MGALCFEERLQIIGALVQVGVPGLTQQALADITDLSQMAITVHIDYMLSTDIIRVKYTDIGKVYTADMDLLESLFIYLSDNYGAGARLLGNAAAQNSVALLGT